MANSYMTKIISINSSPGASAEAWYQIGTLHDIANNIPSATEAYQNALTRFPTHTKCLQSYAWLIYKNGDSSKAVEFLQRALGYDDSDGVTYYLIGRIYMANLDFRVAYDNYQRAVHLDEKNPNFWCSIASLYYQRRQYRDALDAYTRAVRINPDIAEIWFDLGTLYEAYSNFGEAMEAFQRAAKLKPHNIAFTQRIAALRTNNMNGTPLQGPSDRPLSDGPEMTPASRIGQRPHIKCDVVRRYGLLMPPSDIQNIKPSAPVPSNHPSALPSFRSLAGDRQLGPGALPVVNGPAPVKQNGIHQTQNMQSMSNGLMSRANAPKQEDMPIGSSHSPQSRAAPITGPRQESMYHQQPQHQPPQHADGKPVRYPGSARAPTDVVANVHYSSQMSTAPQIDSRMTDYPRSSMSQDYRRPGSNPADQGSQQPFSRGYPSSEAMRDRPPQFSQPIHPSSASLSTHDEQSRPRNGMAQEHSRPGDSKWPSAPAVGIPPYSRNHQTPHGYPSNEAPADRNTMGSTATQAGALPASMGLSSRLRSEPVEQAANIPASRPVETTDLSHTTSQALLHGARSISKPDTNANPATAYGLRTTEESRYSGAKENENIPSANNRSPPRSGSDKLSQLSGTPPRDKMAQEPFHSTEAKHKTANMTPVSAPSTFTSSNEFSMERKEGRSESHLSHPGNRTSRPQLLNPIQDGQMRPKLNTAKPDSPVDEEMLPRLPPLPPAQGEQRNMSAGMDTNRPLFRDGHAQRIPLVTAQPVPTRSDAQHTNAMNRPEAKGDEGSAFGPHGPPISRAQDTGRDGPSTIPSTTMSGSADRRYDNPPASQSDMYSRQAASPPLRRVTENTPLSGSSRAMPISSMMIRSETRRVVNGGVGQMSSPLHSAHKGPDTLSSPTPVRRDAYAPQSSGNEKVVKTGSPVPPRSHQPSTSAHLPAPHQAGPEGAPLPLHSTGLTKFPRGDGSSGKQSEGYSYMQGREKTENHHQLPRVPSTGIRSSLQLANNGGIPTLKKPRLQPFGSDQGQREKSPSPFEGRDGKGSHGPSVRNPFGSGISASFSKSLSRSGPSGPIGVVSMNGSGAAADMATGPSTSGSIRSPGKRDDRAIRSNSREDIPGLGKRNATVYENGSVGTGKSDSYGKFVSKPSVFGPSPEMKLRSPERAQQPPHFKGTTPPYRPGMDGRGFADSNAEVNRPKIHHTAAESNGGNRFNGGDL